MKIEYELDDDAEVFEVDGFPGLKIPTSVRDKFLDVGRFDASKTFKSKLMPALSKHLPEGFNSDKASARDISEVIASAMTQRDEKYNSLIEQIKTDKDKGGKSEPIDLEKLTQKIESKYAAEFQAKESTMMQGVAIQGAKARIKSQLQGVSKDALPYLDAMIDNVVDFEFDNGKVEFKQKGSDKYWYVGENQASEADVADLIKKNNNFAFSDSKKFLNSQPTNGVSGTVLDPVKATMEDVRALIT